MVIAGLLFWLFWSNSPESLTQKADQLMEQQQYAQAQEAYEKAYEKNPDYFPACIGLAKSLYLGGKPNEAISLLRERTEEEAVLLLQEYLPVHAISLEAGTYKELKTVTLSSENGASIYYTLDGSQPDSSSTKYTEPFVLPVGKTVCPLWR